MNRFYLNTFAAILALAVQTVLASGQELTSTNILRGMSYPEIKTAHLQALMLGGSQQQRLEWLRDIVRAGPYGDRGLTQIFKGFEGRYQLDPAMPGVEKTARYLASASPSQRKGAARTLTYAQAIYNDPRFTLKAVNELVYTPQGRISTDRDLVYEHKLTGQRWGFEVKEVGVAAQRSNIRQYKTQIDKMALEYRKTGQMHAFVNRREIIPELKAYARQVGVPIFENAMTGKSALESASGFNRAVLGEIDRMSHAAAATKLSLGATSLQTGMGAWVLYESVPAIWSEIDRFVSKGDRTLTDYLQLGQKSSMVILGATQLTAGSIALGARFSQTIATSSRLATISRSAGPFGLVALVGVEAFSVAGWLNGDVTNRQFITGQAEFVIGAGGAIAGGWAGAWAGAGAGAAIGSFFGPPGTAIGAAIGGTTGMLGGGVGGGLAGAWLGGRGMNAVYQLQDEKERKQLEAFIYSHYGVK